MSKSILRPLYSAVLFAVIFGCGGSGVDLAAPPAAGAFFETVGGTIRMRGRIAFVDAAGQPVAAPAEGAIAIAGTGSIAAGTDVMGNFTIEGLPVGSNLRIRAFARGFLPVDFIVVAGTTSFTNRLVCKVDLNAGDNPTFLNELFAVDDAGIMHYTASSQLGTELTLFTSTALSPKSYTGVGGQTLQVSGNQQGNLMAFTGIIGSQIPTGTFFALLEGTDGSAVRGYGTCQLTLANYTRGGKLVSGKITGPGGVGCTGAEVLGWEEGNTGNNGSTTSGATGGGNFSLGLGAAPTAPVSIQVQWTDPATGITYVCWFSGNP